MLLEPLVSKIFVGVTSVSLIGLGGMVLRHESQIAVQGSQYTEIIRRLERIDNKLEGLPSDGFDREIAKVLKEIKQEQQNQRGDINRIYNHLSPRRDP